MKNFFQTNLFKIFRINELPHEEKFSKNHAYLFLHSCYFNMEDAKKAVKKYCELRVKNFDLFGNRDPLQEDTQKALDIS